VEIIACALRRKRARLLVIDPMTSFLGGISWKDDPDVRDLLFPLQQMAESLRVALLATMHKPKVPHRNANHAAIGSVAFGAVARMNFHVTAYKAPGQSIFYWAGGNCAARPAALVFRLDTNGSLRWDRKQTLGVYDPHRLHVDLENTTKDPVDEVEALDVLRQFVRERQGGPFTVGDAYAAGAAYGLSERSIRGVRIKVGLLKGKERKKNGPWWWWDPTRVGEHPNGLKAILP
jgi:hypothetical protein